MWAPEENSLTDRLDSSPMLGGVGGLWGDGPPECVPDPLHANLCARPGLRLPTHAVGTAPPPLGGARLQLDTIKAPCPAQDFCSVFLVNEHTTAYPVAPAPPQGHSVPDYSSPG